MRRLLAFAALAIAGCARPVPLAGPVPEYVQLGELELSATVEQEGVDLMGSVDIMNTSREPVTLRYTGGCAVSLVLLPQSGRSARPRWDEFEWLRPHTDACRPDPLVLEIPPRTLARLLTPAVTSMQILGDSIPPGEYPAGVRLRMLQPRDTTLLLRANPVQLGS